MHHVYALTLPEMTTENFFTEMQQAYESWLSSQSAQVSAYDYEQSYEAFVMEYSRKLLQHSMGALPKSHSSKKKSGPDMEK